MEKGKGWGVRLDAWGALDECVCVCVRELTYSSTRVSCSTKVSSAAAT
jgi:hypothetical protein